MCYRIIGSKLYNDKIVIKLIISLFLVLPGVYFLVLVIPSKGNTSVWMNTIFQLDWDLKKSNCSCEVTTSNICGAADRKLFCNSLHILVKHFYSLILTDILDFWISWSEHSRHSYGFTSNSYFYSQNRLSTLVAEFFRMLVEVVQQFFQASVCWNFLRGS